MAVYVLANVPAIEGKEGELERSFTAIVNATREHDSALAFGLFHSDAPSTYMLIEVYEDSAAAMAHIDGVQHLFPAVRACVDPERRSPLRIFGDPSPELRARYESMGAQIFDTVAAT
jgi:quinol monooxygenase YgiN